jgi:N-acetyltransferase 10
MRKKIPSCIRTILENALIQYTRSFFVILGDRGKDQVINLFNLWLAINKEKNMDFNPASPPKILWSYKTDLGFSSHQTKRKKEISKLMKQGLYESSTDHPFEKFLTKTDIRFCYYRDSHKVLGSNYDVLILQDFESLTPNILCRTIETVKGNGLVFMLLKKMSSLKQLYTLTMDVHQRFKTKAFDTVYPRFNERFLLSLAKCQSAVFVDDELNLLKITSKKPEAISIDSKKGIILCTH